MRLGLGIGITQPGTGGGGAPPVTPSTWSPADKSGGLTLSNGNLTWTGDNSYNNYRGIRSTESKASGKKYYEITCLSEFFGACGFANSTEALGSQPGVSNDAIAYFDNGGAVYNGGNTALAAYIVGDVIGCAIDIPNGLVWYRKNGAWQNSGDPATGVNGISVPGIGSPVFAFAASWVTNNQQQVANFGATAFAYAVPTGFSAWDS